ncbi:Gamma-tubulin complex component 4 [Nymphaea thermarum]|nr:Gamma-tubulin complex component 4 [Nymphaea thermarum]
MLHEVLLALLGHTGDFVIKQKDESGKVVFKLAPDLAFVQPSERDVIERLVCLGLYYRKLTEFVAKSRNPNVAWITYGNVQNQAPVSLKVENKMPSVYRKAIANGVAEILSVYRSAVLQVEQQVLADPVPILATVTKGLYEFDMLLAPLSEFVVEIECNDVRGGQLLNLLYKRCHCGVPELQACMQRLLWHGHQVMYRQLAAWMVHGLLQDQYGEFFIRRQENVEGEQTLHHSGHPSKKDTQKSLEDASLTDWNSGFHVFLDMLPQYIHMRVAESILFSGKAIRVLRNPSPAFRCKADVFHHGVPRGSNKYQGLLGCFAQKEPCIDTQLVGEELFPQSEADKIVDMLQELRESPEFHKRSFEHAVDSTRMIAAGHLWQLVVVHADLDGHLKALKDYFLLAKGDFFQCFLEESRQLMRLPPRYSTAEADLMVPFQLAASKTIGDDDKYFSRVSLRLQSEVKAVSSQLDLSSLKIGGEKSSDSLLGISSLGPVPDGWDAIALEYSVDWPLQLFFTQEVLSKYRRVFQYLLKLKRTQMELEKSWASAMHQDHMDFAKNRKDRRKCSEQRRQHSRPMWHVREHMVFLITNLQFYIQVDVIESQWNRLQERLQGSHDFTDLVNFHHEYLSALISQSFLDIGSVSRILEGLMKLCLQFCWNVERHEGCPSTSELEHIAEEFNKKSNSLYTILRSSKIAGSQRAPFLRQFLLRLNFNSFFEATARGVLNVIRSRPPLHQ